MDHTSPRIIGIRSNVFERVFHQVDDLTYRQDYFVVAIDGRCASGKTRLAQLLSKKFDARVVHIDEFYLPLEERRSDWKEHPGANIDFKRLAREALLPGFYSIFFKEAERGNIEYRPYSCKEKQYLEPKKLPVQQITVIEGTYAFHPELLEEFQKIARSDPDLKKRYLPNNDSWKYPYDIEIFLTCSKDIQYRRLKRREGENLENFEKLWIPLEEKYFKTCEKAKDRWTIKVDTGVNRTIKPV